jgi:voltage-gated potassium channel Kch
LSQRSTAHLADVVVNLHEISERTVGWRWWTAAGLFLAGYVGLSAGVTLTERPEVGDAGALTKAYYVLGLFVVGGLDVGTPSGGPAWARFILWIAYFGAPIFTASAVIEAIVRVVAPDRWRLRRIKDHTIVFGSTQLTLSYLSVLRRRSPRARVVVVDKAFEAVREQELQNRFRATTIVGDLTHDYLLRHLRLRKAKRVLLLGDNDFEAYEAASRILTIAPALEGKVILHCHNLRFMRSLQDTALAQQCTTFNTYHLAAQSFVRDQLMEHFKATAARDTVVVAGFGRFGQSVLEELQHVAGDDLEQVLVVDRDADRRILVVEEQERIGAGYARQVFQGDISHPDVWRRLTQSIDLRETEPTIILGTGQEQDNLRTALWIKQKYANALVFARTYDISQFALEVGVEHDINSISITQLVENNIPPHWID